MDVSRLRMTGAIRPMLSSKDYYFPSVKLYFCNIIAGVFVEMRFSSESRGAERAAPLAIISGESWRRVPASNGPDCCLSAPSDFKYAS